MTAAKLLSCAIYTRKSSDEGLDQAFNSLDAQREAGEAYVKSQASEGWRVSPARYDDGGYSGGTMERPGLQRLLADIDAGKVDVVVVYKIDRLTRSLADFARIVERFDARGASFVSVTQAFNTTSSMGRLTLNVLLSFAQFEREVTGERIRDKIAASKAKGMWMGGVPPLGYDLPDPGTHVLRVNADEATIVRQIFVRYVELGSVHRLAAELAASGIVSKRRVTASGKTMGGVSFSRGALFHLLRNPIYLGLIPHKELRYQGSHEAIVDPAIFEAVQQQLKCHARREGPVPARTGGAALTGRLFDAAGNPMSPTHSRGRSGKLYRYYVTAPLQQGCSPATAPNLPQRVAAAAIERCVMTTIVRLVPNAPAPLDLPERIVILSDALELLVPASLALTVEPRLALGETLITHPADTRHCLIRLPIALGRRGGSTTIVAATQPQTISRDRALIAALQRAHTMVQRDRDGPLIAVAPASQYERRLAALALLAPDLQRDILAGRQPPSLTLATLIARDLPLDWQAQRSVLGWSG